MYFHKYSSSTWHTCEKTCSFMKVLIYAYHHLIDEKHHFLITSRKWWQLHTCVSALRFGLLPAWSHCSEVLLREAEREILPNSVKFCCPRYLLIQTTTANLVMITLSPSLLPAIRWNQHGYWHPSSPQVEKSPALPSGLKKDSFTYHLLQMFVSPILDDTQYQHYTTCYTTSTLPEFFYYKTAIIFSVV